MILHFQRFGFVALMHQQTLGAGELEAGPKIPGREGPAALDMADHAAGEAQSDQRMVDLEAAECQTAREHANHFAAEPAHVVDVVDGYVERHAAALLDIGKPATVSRWRAAAHAAHDAYS